VKASASALVADSSVSASATQSRKQLAWPSIAETLFALAAIVLLAPLYIPVSGDGFVRDRRFDADTVRVEGLPDAVLRSVCRSHGPHAEPEVRNRLCGSQGSVAVATSAASLPEALAKSRSRIAAAFRAALANAEQALAAQDPVALPDPSPGGRPLERDIAGFASRYGLDRTGSSGPRSVECAFDQVGALARSRDAPDRPPQHLANAVLLLAAALDGHRATSALASSASLPWIRPVNSGSCASASLAEALTRAAATMIDVRTSAVDDAKKAAMRELLASAKWQWCAWMVAGLLLIKSSRTRLPVTSGIALALVVWATAAWAGRVPWPLAADKALELGRAGPSFDAIPANFVIALLVIAAGLLVLSRLFRRRVPAIEQTLSTRIGYAGLVVATGIGGLLLLDLSANGPPANRYLALYHHGHLWLAMLVLTVLAFLRPVLGRGLAWLLSVLDELGGRVAQRLGPLLAPAAMLALTALFVGSVAVLLSGVRQFTSELGRLWLILGVAWFFFLRGAPVAGHVARSGGPIVSLLRYAWPLALVGVVLVALMLVTRDMGPLLIASYAAGAFLAACIAMWWHSRSGATYAPALLAALSFAAWIVTITLLVFEFGAIHAVTADRLENLAAPLASANDQLALVTWFRDAAPASGFGVGAVPWCGFAASVGCAGVPAQIQSDYTFTALVGTFGEAAAWTFTVGCALWLHRLVRYHGRVTRGEPRFVRHEGRIVADSQAFLSWIAVTWVVLTLCQLAVTVAGNLAVLPLTGVTFPFVSFGMTSLIVNCAMVALCLNVSCVQENERG
jgi:cell division protein FtsW (lipid II flippase)